MKQVGDKEHTFWGEKWSLFLTSPFSFASALIASIADNRKGRRPGPATYVVTFKTIKNFFGLQKLEARLANPNHDFFITRRAKSARTRGCLCHLKPPLAQKPPPTLSCQQREHCCWDTSCSSQDIRTARCQFLGIS